MSRSTVQRSKSSPCCIGCIVLLLIALGLSLALGIYMYKFTKNNISFPNVANKPDPALNTLPEQLLPATVGRFERTSLHDTLENVPQSQWQDLNTSSAHVASYEDPQGHIVTVIAMNTSEAGADRQTGLGVLVRNSSDGSSDVGITIKDPFSSPDANYVTTWSKPNWTFMVQTTSTLTSQFLENFNPVQPPIPEESTPADASTTNTQPEDQPTTTP